MCQGDGHNINIQKERETMSKGRTFESKCPGLSSDYGNTEAMPVLHLHYT